MAAVFNEKIRENYFEAGRIASAARKYGAGLISGGVTLYDVAEKVEEKILNLGGEVAFPVNLAIDENAAHYTPFPGDKLRFKRGQLVKLDVGAHIDGYIADTAETIEVDSTDNTTLVQASRQALNNAMELFKPGVKLREVGRTVESTIDMFGYKPISNLTGHSLEQFKLHAGVSVPNVDERTPGKIKEGMAVAIEPFATTGHGKVISGRDSNIYHFQKVKPIAHAESAMLLEKIADQNNGLPFSARWCSQFTKKWKICLKKLVNARAITVYKILKERGNGLVTQAEHTVLITKDGYEPTTT